jgi:hypothetical protein
MVSGMNAFSQCPEGMVSYWNLDEIGATTYQDQVGGHPALVENAPTDVSGIIGSAKYFDGTKRVSIASHPDYNFANDQGFTIALWAKFTDVTFGTYNKVLLGKNEPYATMGAKWWIAAQMNSGLVGFHLEDSNGNGYDVFAPAINDNSWHYIVAVRNPTDNTIKLYIDGSLASSVLATYTGNFTSAAPIQVGYLNRNSIPDYWYKGALDEMAIYNRALDASEISSHWTKGSLGIGYCDGYAPVIKTEPPVTAAVGQEYRYDVNASGMPSIVYTLDAAPVGMNINPSTGLITWTPGSTDDEAFVRVIASNPSYPPDAVQEFNINIGEAPSCPTGLLGLWKLDETSGPVYADYYGLHDAVATVSPSPAAGIVDGAQTFDNTSTINIPHAEAWEWNRSESFTLQAWVKTSNSANNDALVFIGRVRKDEWFTNWWLGIDDQERPVFYLRDSWGEDGIVTGSQSLADGAWHYVVGVRDGSAGVSKLFVDGVKVGELSVTYGHSFTTDPNDSIPVNVGWFDSGSGHRFTGQMDELAVFSRALSEADVTRFYNNGNPEGHCAIGNYSPIIISEPVTTAMEDELYEYIFEADDFNEEDILILSAIEKPSWLEFNHTLGLREATLSGTPINENVGDTTVILRVSDGELQRDQEFTLTVENSNDPVKIISIPDTVVDEGAAYTYLVEVEDVDEADTISVLAPTLPGWLSWDEETLTLSGTPANEDVGDHNVLITASDGTETDSQDFTITVNKVNEVPQITGQVPLYVRNDQTLTLSLDHFTVEDPDNTYPDDFTLIVSNGNNYTFDGVTITPEAGFIGNINVGVQVNDGMASSAVYFALVEVGWPTAVSQVTIDEIVHVYPNPVSEVIHFKFEKRVNKGSIEIYNTIGNLIKMVNVDADIVKVDATDMNQGSYFYRISIENEEVIFGHFTVLKN